MTDQKKCPFCAEDIQAAAIKCRYCGEFLNTQSEGTIALNLETKSLPPVTRSREYSPGLALCLGLLFPAFGQFYEERVGAGIGFLLLITAFILGGFITWFFWLLIPIIQLVAAIESFVYIPDPEYLSDAVDEPAQYPSNESA